jgi:hypothetical protein
MTASQYQNPLGDPAFLLKRASYETAFSFPVRALETLEAAITIDPSSKPMMEFALEVAVKYGPPSATYKWLKRLTVAGIDGDGGRVSE